MRGNAHLVPLGAGAARVGVADGAAFGVRVEPVRHQSHHDLLCLLLAALPPPAARTEGAAAIDVRDAAREVDT